MTNSSEFKASEDSGSAYYPKTNYQSVLIPAIGLLILSLLVIVFRAHTYAEPLERDITTYAIAGHGLLHGQPLYTQNWDNRPPAIYIVHALSELIFGFGENSIYAMNVIANIITLIAVYFAGIKYSGRAITGLAAGAFWVLMSQSLVFESNQPNSEVFINGCWAAIFAILISDKRLSNKTVFFIGLLTTWATFFKQIALVPVYFLLASRIICTDSQNRKKYFAEAIDITLTVVFGWLLLVAWSLLSGSFTDFYEAVFVYNLIYAEHGYAKAFMDFWFLLAKGLSLDPGMLAVLAMAFIISIVTIIRKDPLSKFWIHWRFYLAGVIVTMYLPHHHYPHYFQLLLPPAAIGGGLGPRFSKKICYCRVKYITFSSTKSYDFVLLHMLGYIVTVDIFWSSFL